MIFVGGRTNLWCIYGLKADMSIIWKAEANFTQYHPLGHVILFERMHLSLYSHCLCVYFLEYLLPQFDKLAELCSSLLAYFFQEKEKGKQKVSLARRDFWVRCVRALLSPRRSCWGPPFEEPIVF